MDKSPLGLFVLAVLLLIITSVYVRSYNEHSTLDPMPEPEFSIKCTTEPPIEVTEPELIIEPAVEVHMLVVRTAYVWQCPSLRQRRRLGVEVLCS